MNNNYNKYLKYKNKYILLRNKVGGYKLSSNKPGHFMEFIKRKIGSNTIYFDFDIGTHTKKKDFDDTFDFLMKDEEYNSIIDYLLKEYVSDTEYTEKHSKIPTQINRYHVNFGAFMVLNFIIELELFTLFHSIFPYNTTERPSKNTFPTIFNKSDRNSIYRVYKDEVDKPFFDKLDLFTNTLDNLFVKFMEDLIKNICAYFEISSSIILNNFVPSEDTSFDYIYVNWKERLINFFQSGYQKKSNEELKGEINKLISTTIISIEVDDLNYIAEGVGFFSYIFLNYPDKQNVLFGSCITYSIFELYIMSRLHIDAYHLVLLVENEDVNLHKHSYWTLSQQTLKKSFTHFATNYPFSQNPITLRSFFQNTARLNFKDNKKEMLKVLLYMIFDSYIKYIKDIKYEREKLDRFILLIRKRIEHIETFFGINFTNDDILDYLNRESQNKSRLQNINIDKLFKLENVKQILLKSNYEEIICNAFKNGNYELILKIIELIHLEMRLTLTQNPDENLINTLLTINHDINIKDLDGKTALIYAVINENINLVILLQQKGANIDLQDNNGKTALMYAVISKNRNILLLLLKDVADIDLRDIDGKTALMYAAINNFLSIISLLEKKPNINLKDYFNRTALIHAVINNSLFSATQLLKNNANVNIQDSYRKTALIYAISNNNIKIVKLLLDWNADTSIQYLTSVTILISAINNIDILNLLLDKGVDINMQNNSNITALIYAVNYNKINVVTFLLDRGANIDLHDSNEQTPLIYAILNKNIEVVELLLKRGANIDLQDSNKQTPLIYAILNKNIEVVELLLKRGANIDLQDSNKQTPLIYAILNENIEVVELLLERGANINLQDSNGRTALMFAAINNDIDAVTLLLNREADFNLQDIDGKTAIMLANTKNNKEIVELLHVKGARLIN